MLEETIARLAKRNIVTEITTYIGLSGSVVHRAEVAPNKWKAQLSDISFNFKVVSDSFEGLDREIGKKMIAVEPIIDAIDKKEEQSVYETLPADAFFL